MIAFLVVRTLTLKNEPVRPGEKKVGFGAPTDHWGFCVEQLSVTAFLLSCGLPALYVRCNACI